MSIESAKAFYDRMVTDEVFQTQHRNAVNDDERREIVLAAGYNFTPEEWEAATIQIQESSDSELSDAQLEAVSGGIAEGGCFTPVFPMYGVPLPNDPPIFPLDPPINPSLPK